MNRTIKEATVKRFHYESHGQLRTHLADFMTAYSLPAGLRAQPVIKFCLFGGLCSIPRAEGLHGSRAGTE